MPFAVAGVPGVFATEADALAAANPQPDKPTKSQAKRIEAQAKPEDEKGGEAA